ncbi:MAG: Recombination protein RecR [Parcubacteria group bacterium GW2011_GWA2_51_10]|nr:MAG: Recombination protein RecR [Parcubacteria group bacterium GW2011_GWA2_51_10]
MDSLERLASLFEKFPGIGPRQAERFVQYLLRGGSALRRELAKTIEELSGAVERCSECMRFFASLKKSATPVCTICADKDRDAKLLAIVASNADLNALERSHTYRGRYFVLGGTISLASEKTNHLRMRELLSSIPARARNGLREIILALPANPEGDATAVRLREELAPLSKESKFAITSLGRGLSTGSELEYADPDTIKNALAGRK